MAAPSRARAFFEEIKSQGVSFLNGLIGSPTPVFESEFLEFKGMRTLDVNDDHVWELWAKALSGFANGDGGVLIFGIDAPKAAAKSFSAVADVGRLCERLKDKRPRITEPPVLGVEIEPFPDAPTSKSGYVVCFIPPSPWRPHQVRAGGQPGQFYVRVGDSFEPCTHAALRALFAPQSVSILEVYYSVFRKRWAGRSDQLFVTLRLFNRGPATASEVFVLFKTNVSIENFELRLWESVGTGNQQAFVCRRSIHPEDSVHMFHFSIGYESALSLGPYLVSISARNQLPLVFEVRLVQEDLVQPVEKKASLIEKRRVDATIRRSSRPIAATPPRQSPVIQRGNRGQKTSQENRQYRER